MQFVRHVVSQHSSGDNSRVAVRRTWTSFQPRSPRSDSRCSAECRVDPGSFVSPVRPHRPSRRRKACWRRRSWWRSTSSLGTQESLQESLPIFPGPPEMSVLGAAAPLRQHAYDIVTVSHEQPGSWVAFILCPVLFCAFKSHCQ